MKRMLCENFFRLTKSMECWLGMVLTSLFALISAVFYLGQNEVYVDEWALGGLTFLFIFGSAVIGIYLFHDHSEGTLRLKLSSGNSRVVFYIADLITSFCYMLVLGLVYAVTILLASRADLNTQGFDIGAARVSSLLLIGILLSNTAITVLLGMAFKNVLGAVMPMLVNVIMTFLMTLVMNGTEKGSFSEYVFKSLPYSQVQYLSCVSVPKDIPLLLISSGIAALTATVAGIAIFRHSDIK